MRTREEKKSSMKLRKLNYNVPNKSDENFIRLRCRRI